MSQSFVASLRKVGLIPPLSVRDALSGFQTAPESMRELTRIMGLRSLTPFALLNQFVYYDSEDFIQGLAFISDSNSVMSEWTNLVFASKRRIFRCVVKGSIYEPTQIVRTNPIGDKPTYIDDTKLTKLTGQKFDGSHYGHISAPCYRDEIIFVPVEYSESKQPAMLLGLSTNLELIAFSYLGGRKNSNGDYDYSAPCCEVDPWDRNILWIPQDVKDDLTECLRAYDVSPFFEILNKADQWGKELTINLNENKKFFFYQPDGSPENDGTEEHALKCVQGIAFSKNGRLYLTRCNQDSWGEYYNRIGIYSALTGRRFGHKQREYNFQNMTNDEIEGVSIHPSGVFYVTVSGQDYFHVHAFKYPDSAFPM